MSDIVILKPKAQKAEYSQHQLKLSFCFLGTGAIPEPWCGCRTCSETRRRQGKNIRTNACGFLSPDVIIDIPGSILTQAPLFGVDLLQIRHLLITHSHGDHFCPEILLRRRNEVVCTLTGRRIRFADIKLPTLAIYSNRTVIDKITETLGDALEQCQLSLTVLEPFQEYRCGAMTIIPLLSSHPVPGEKPLNYIIKQAGKTMLYAIDTFKFLPETFSQIRKQVYDLVVLEASEGKTSTVMKQFEIGGHLNLIEAEKIYHTFVEEGLLREQSIFALSHLSHYTGLYDDLAPEYSAKGITIAHDGMGISL